MSIEQIKYVSKEKKTREKERSEDTERERAQEKLRAQRERKEKKEIACYMLRTSKYLADQVNYWCHCCLVKDHLNGNLLQNTS